MIYARHCEIKEINSKETREFMNEYHLQGYSASKINIGIHYNNELMGVMTFSKPRFGNETEYEIIRIVYKYRVNIVGGTERIFRYFINTYNPNSILTYADISKFTGNVYRRLGFRYYDNNMVTKPGYIWFNAENNSILKRYQTQKQKLLKMGLGGIEQTEDEIMKSLGYIKIYDKGNLKLIWTKEEI